MSAVPNLTRTRGAHFLTNPPLTSKLGEIDQARVLRMFRSGLDTHEIASKLACTPAAAANGLANARERERSR